MIAVTFRHKQWLVLCAVLLLSSCTLRLAYHFLDWGLQWRLQHYLSLSKEQSAMAKNAIRLFHRWHQQHELPIYAEYLAYIQQRMNSPERLTADDIHIESDKIQLFVDNSVNQLLPPITDLLASLNDKQIADLAKTLADDRQDYAKKYVKPSPSELQRKLAEDLKDYLEPHIGKLTKEQNTWVTQWSQQLKPFGSLMVAQQHIWADTLITTLQNRHDKQRLRLELQQLLLYRTENWQPDAREVARANEKLSLELIAHILNNLSNKQRKTLQENLEIYRQDCLKLIAEFQP